MAASLIITDNKAVNDAFRATEYNEIKQVVNENAAILDTKVDTGAPVTKTADFTLAATEHWIINAKAGSDCVATFPAASTCAGRVVVCKNNVDGYSLLSASSNIVQLDGGAPSATILTDILGKWATLVSDGTNWVIMQAN